MIILILVIVFGGGFYAYRELVPPPVQQAQGPVYSTKPVVRGDISIGVDATGTLNPSRSGSIQAPGGYMDPSTASITYYIKEYLAEEGDEVKQGQIIARLESPDLENQIDTLRDSLEDSKRYLSDLTGIPVEHLDIINPAQGVTLRAPIDGRVIGLSVKEGDEVKQGQIIARIVDDSRFKIEAKLNPNEYQMIKLGQKLALRFNIFDGVYEGEITDVNPNPVPDGDSNSPGRGFVYWITVEGNNPGLVGPGAEVYLGLPSPDNDNTKVLWFANSATVDSYAKEERVLSTVEALATEVHTKEMAKVKKGDPLISLSGADVQLLIQEKLDEIRDKEAQIMQLISKSGQTDIKASMDGILAHWDRQPGERVSPGEWMGYIYNTKDMSMWIEVDDVDVLLVQQGAPVKITVDALPNETFQGEVMQVATMGQDRNGIPRFGVDIKVIGGPKLRPGMQAKAHIDAGSAKDVLLVPLEAIFEEDGSAKVEILNEDGTTKVVTVELGLMNDRVAEVKSGVNEGDLVITGSSADILPSQHIGSKDSLIPSDSDGGSGNENNKGGNGSNAPASN